MSDAAPNLESHLARFGLTAFRPGQRDVIATILAGEDCLCVMPTGGGKSLCYQLPSVARPGVTLVVSPLIALMKDQVDALLQLKIRATLINSTIPAAEQRERMNRMAAGEYDLVYIAPERLRNSLFLEAARTSKVQLLAVDEAHCISHWGHDFRPDYARLGRFRQRLGFPQTVALTATATPTVREDIAKQLQLRSPKVFITGFARPNLRFEVRDAASNDAKENLLFDYLQETPGCGIIYAATRKACEELTENLSQSSLKRNVGLYHAGLLPDQRRMVQDDFMSGKVSVIVATNAFGMGIDKADLRFVIHYNMPGSLEAYYQEAGRAGRDGLPAECVLLYCYSDLKIQEFFIENAYPEPALVRAVYEFLCECQEDPIEMTMLQIKEQLGLPTGTEGIGACEQLLEECGAIERMDAQQNQAAVKIDSDLPTLVDLLPRDAKVRRKVLQSVEKIVGAMRSDWVYFQPLQLLADTGLTRDTINRSLRELCELKAFDYVPPFRGRAIHVLKRVRFDELKIDFTELQRRKDAEYAKLDRVVKFAKTRRCRQLEILDYFGDPNKATCGTCDNCGGPRANRSGETDSETPLDPAVIEAVRMALSGVARMHGRFGKQMVVLMLCGSKAKNITKFKLDKLSTFGLLSRLAQTEVGELLDGLLAIRLLEQEEIDRFRPILRLTEAGTAVMRGERGLDGLSLSPELVAKIRGEAPPAEQRAPLAPLRGEGQGVRGRKSVREHPSPPTPPPEAGRGERAFQQLPPVHRPEPIRKPPVKPTRAPIDLDALDVEPTPSLSEADKRLLQRLREWRQDVADRMGLSASEVGTKSLLERIAKARPKTVRDLSRIKGMSADLCELFGLQLVRLITEAERATPATEQPSAAPLVAETLDRPPFDESDFTVVDDSFNRAPNGPRANGDLTPHDGLLDAIPRGPLGTRLNEAHPADRDGDTDPATQPAYYWTWRLLAAGFSVAETSHVRGLPAETITDHALRAAEAGLKQEPRWFFTAETLRALDKVVGDSPPDRIRPLLEQLPDGIGYTEVQLYLRIRSPS